LWPRPLKLRELGEGVRKEDSGALRHAKVTTTLDLYFQSIDAAKLEAQEDIAWRLQAPQSQPISSENGDAQYDKLELSLKTHRIGLI